MNYENFKTPKSWLAFELNVLRRLEFKSISLPSTIDPKLGSYLKNWDIKIIANDFLRSSYFESVAAIENNELELSENEIEMVLEDAYVPQYELKNPALKNWFGETDAWWFDNVRDNIEKLDSPLSKSIAISLGMQVGDYALSFDSETRQLRQPFSTVFKRFWGIMPKPVDNGQENVCQNKNTNEFTAENYTDLLFLRLPQPRQVSLKRFLGNDAWKEEWVCGNDKFWPQLEEQLAGNMGAHVETKFQYLSLLEELFMTASHIPQWSIVHTEDSFVSTQDIVESIGKVRRVDTIYTKDFSELMGTKAVLITA